MRTMIRAGAVFLGVLLVPLIPHASPPGSWSPAASMAVARLLHTITLLPDGRVLVTGGNTTGFATTATAEIYNPTTNTWISAGAMTTSRSRHTATLLTDGTVLVVGGRVNNFGPSTASVEVYNPITNTWSSTGSMAIARDFHTASLLPDGRVLVAGGVNVADISHPIEKTAEIYNSLTGTWSSTDQMAVPRAQHRASSLPDGRVLVTGGIVGGDCVHLATAEIFDPQAGRWRNADPMHTPRGLHAARPLADGRVLVAGGFTLPDSGCFNSTATAELFDVTTGKWTPTGNLATALAGVESTILLNDGTVLLPGGQVPVGDFHVATATVELYDPVTGTWSLVSNMTTARTGHRGTILADGRVLVTGGFGPGGVRQSAELYTP